MNNIKKNMIIFIKFKLEKLLNLIRRNNFFK